MSTPVKLPIPSLEAISAENVVVNSGPTVGSMKSGVPYFSSEKLAYKRANTNNP